MKVILKLQSKNLTTEIPMEMNTSVIFGRSSSTDHKISDELMSSRHLMITLWPTKLEVKDLESKNGTYLNGIRIEQAEVFVGDEIKAGSTKISIFSDKMDPKSVEDLTFPGGSKERISHELRLDFTGARQMNQQYFLNTRGTHNHPTPSSMEREVEVRKRAHSKIKLSKEEIKNRNKVRSSMASTIDVLLLVMVIALPLIATNLIIMMNPFLMQQNRTTMILGSEIVIVAIFFVLNFKMLKFSLGEKMAGIEKIYLNQ